MGQENMKRVLSKIRLKNTDLEEITFAYFGSKRQTYKI